jgi:cytochrome b
MPKLARTDPAPVNGAYPLGVRVWDPVVRLFHWSLVAGFATAWFSANRAENLHVWTGYAAGGLILLRLVWGLVGTRYARFSSFVTGPRRTLAYAASILNGTEARHIGHNPAGGAMVVVLMAGVVGLAVCRDPWRNVDSLA